MTRVRYRVVAFAVTLAFITYLDRVCISILAPSMMSDLSLNQVQMSYVFSAFTLAYALFEVPTAWWADRIGSRQVLTRIVAWWSCFTIGTAFVNGFASLLAVRFLFGAGEAGAWPNATRVFSRWIPARERGRIQGIFFAGAHLSGGLTPVLVTWMAVFLSWRTVFAVFGLTGFVWAWAWFRWFRDEPRDHPAANDAERVMIERERRLDEGSHALDRSLLGHGSLIPLCLMYFANGYGFYFVITWLPTYLAKVRGFASHELALFSGLPLLLSVLADLGGGWTTDALTRRFGARWGRASVGFGAYAVAAIAILAGTYLDHARLAAAAIAVAAAASMFTLAPSWAICIDIGGQRSAVLSAIMNTAGQVGGVLSPIVLAYLVQWFASWAFPLYVMAGLYGIAAVCWLFIRPNSP